MTGGACVRERGHPVGRARGLGAAASSRRAPATRRGAGEGSVTRARAATATPADDIDADAVALLSAFGKVLEAQPQLQLRGRFQLRRRAGGRAEARVRRVARLHRSASGSPAHRRGAPRRRAGASSSTTATRSDGVHPGRQRLRARQAEAAPRSRLHARRSCATRSTSTVPLGDLLRANPLTRIEEGMRLGVHRRARDAARASSASTWRWQTDEVDAEAWFATGDQPLLAARGDRLPRRSRVSRASARSSRTGTRSPDVADSVFAFTPPADAERVRFSVRGKNFEPPEEQKP